MPTARNQHLAYDLEGLPPIKVIGVGGGGGNSVKRMIAEQMLGVEFIVVNTDAQALNQNDAPVKIRIGDKLTKGLGVGGDPGIGMRAAEESQDELADAVRGAEMVFITAGMGGGTGTGAAPVIAELARQAGALSVAIVTKPFAWEGAKRRRQAEEGISRLREKVDTLIVIPNDRLSSVFDQDVTVEAAFRGADDILHQGIRGIAELILRPGLINLDFADVKKIMHNAGSALLAIGRGTGDNRAVEAAKAAIASPLLEQDIHGARGLLYNITGPQTMTLQEVGLASQIINEMLDPEAEIIFGTVIDNAMGEEVQITLIATGFDAPEPEGQRRSGYGQQAGGHTTQPQQAGYQPYAPQPPVYQQPAPTYQEVYEPPVQQPRRGPADQNINGDGGDDYPPFLRRTMRGG